MIDYSQFPMGSPDPRVAKVNKENFDLFSVSMDLTYTDRFGVPRTTMHGMELAVQGLVLASPINDGLMSKEDKVKVNSLGSAAYINTGAVANAVPKNSDLGSASKSDVGTPSEIAAGDVNKLATGAGVRSTLGGYGIGGFVAEKAFVDLNITNGGFFGIPSSDPNNPAAVSPIAMHAQAGAAFGGGLLLDRSANPRGWLYSVRNGVVVSREIWSKGNTTVDSNGFIKQASPIINLFSDKIEPNESLEVASAEFERVDIGHYVIRNVPKLSRNGWYIETPKDRNNNIYFTIDYDESVEGELTIRTYEPDYSTGRAINGAPMDIIEGRFVALRFEEIPELYPVPEEVENEESINHDSN